MTWRAVGTDTSGRPIRMSPVMADWWDRYVARLGFRPTITQGGWMGDLAAAASGPTHDGDALDLRVWDRTQTQVEAMVREARALGAAAWLRNKRHGGFSDPHVHLVPGRWAHPSASALRQWDSLRSGRDGLKSNGPDYHPYPLSPTPGNDIEVLDMDEKTLRKIIREEAQAAADAAVGKVLDVPMNKKGDAGSADFAGKNLRQTLKGIARDVSRR